ncbi:FHA domain-containing protein [Thermomonas sp.]|jgi:predicted component of type VI protein secretion system|uniref:FHA domain-containing protein n=1 Tax=Thermomonas sp. TaxID=1971895 RepID=UPI001B47B256|nr:FHA domain-containing protein [Thermomonas sp.]MBK6332469.1 FHA domain-containing protein [Thermomonas sp.]MBK6416890.1 FHA domain-containing protein [Thermomonas sp.]MBK6924122.1 FHA domain-containing protein [Thermomonas sp.]MBK7204819.1 FHA domain-containing protein [Thermomonas sp.]MBK9669797.1 FHA domain-containing protein [Thermomonas sp.]
MMMKLVFPAGDRPQMLLDQGAFRIGSAANADLVLASDGIEPLHCELQVGAQGVRMRVPEGIRVLVNERPVEGLIALRADDTVGLASTRFRLLDAAADAGRSASVARSDDAGETNATMVRPVVPKFALRGLSGELFGRSFPLSASLSVGRADDAGLRIPLESISRLHARLTPAGDEVLVEDMGSANGTWLNGKRITRAQAVHGDEIRFDTQRFQLLVPGQAIHAQAQPARNGLRWQWLAAALVVVVAGAAWLLR